MTAHEEIRSDRKFQLWLYSVSHGQLLLRSPKSAVEPSRVDVLFQNVLGLHLPTLMEGLNIELADQQLARFATSNLAAWGPLKSNVFRVFGSDWEGYVVASNVSTHVDDGEHHTPSKLLH